MPKKVKQKTDNEKIQLIQSFSSSRKSFPFEYTPFQMYLNSKSEKMLNSIVERLIITCYIQYCLQIFTVYIYIHRESEEPHTCTHHSIRQLRQAQSTVCSCHLQRQKLDCQLHYILNHGSEIIISLIV